MRPICLLRATAALVYFLFRLREITVSTPLQKYKKREKTLKRVSPPLYYGRVVWAERRMGKRLQKFFSLSFSFYVPFQPLSNNGWYCCTHKNYTQVLLWVPLAKRACQRISIEFPEKKEKKKSCFGGMNQTMQMRKRKNMWDNNARCTLFGSFGRGRRGRGAFNWLIGGDTDTSCVSLISPSKRGKGFTYCQT